MKKQLAFGGRLSLSLSLSRGFVFLCFRLATRTSATENCFCERCTDKCQGKSDCRLPVWGRRRRVDSIKPPENFDRRLANDTKSSGDNRCEIHASPISLIFPFFFFFHSSADIFQVVRSLVSSKRSLKRLSCNLSFADTTGKFELFNDRVLMIH